MGVEGQQTREGWETLLKARTAGVAMTAGDTFVNASHGFADIHDIAPDRLKGGCWRDWYCQDSRTRLVNEALPAVR